MRVGVNVLELERVKQLDDEVLVERLMQSVQRDRQLSVELLVQLSEVQERGLFRDLGFSTMFDYATRRLGMSESEAALRLRAGKLTRAFPIALEMLGRCEIHLTALGILAPVLTPDNIQLLYDARFKTKQQVLELVAKYAPKPDVPDSIRRMPRLSSGARPSARAPQVQNCRSSPTPVPPIAMTAARAAAAEQVQLGPMTAAPAASGGQVPPIAMTAARAAAGDQVPPIAMTAARATAGEQMLPLASTERRASTSELVQSVASTAARAAAVVPVPPLASSERRASTSERVQSVASIAARAAAVVPVPPLASSERRALAGELVPLSPGRHKITFTASQRVRDMLEEARELRRHRDPAGQLEPLFERALELLIADEKKRQFGQTTKPRQARKAASPKRRSRYIPHEVRRQVWRRDSGQCCFCGPDGMRCGARSRLQFHHKLPYERGGPTSTDNLELMCSSHNALLAERDYGRAFILQVRRAKSHAAAHHAKAAGGTLPPIAARQIRASECIRHEIESKSNSKQLASALADEQSTWQQS